MLIVIDKLFLLLIWLEYLVLVVEAHRHFLLDDFDVIDQLHDVVELNFDLQLSKQEFNRTKKGDIGNV